MAVLGLMEWVWKALLLCELTNSGSLPPEKATLTTDGYCYPKDSKVAIENDDKNPKGPVERLQTFEEPQLSDQWAYGNVCCSWPWS